jgi:hypothetical protein
MSPSEIESQLADLHYARGNLSLHGKSTDAVDAEISTLEKMRATMADAEAVKAKMAREALTVEQTKGLAAAKTRLAALVKDDLQDCKEIEVSLRAVVAGLSRRWKRKKEMSDLARAIAGDVPMALNDGDWIQRNAGRFAAIMATIPGHSAHFGSIRWLGGSLYPASQNWHDAEAKRYEKELTPIIGESKNAES